MYSSSLCLWPVFFFGSLLNFLVNNLSLYNLKVEPTVVYVEGNMSLHPKVCILEAFVQYL